MFSSRNVVKPEGRLSIASHHHPFGNTCLVWRFACSASWPNGRLKYNYGTFIIEHYKLRLLCIPLLLAADGAETRSRPLIWPMQPSSSTLVKFVYHDYPINKSQVLSLNQKAKTKHKTASQRASAFETASTIMSFTCSYNFFIDACYETSQR